LGLLLIQVHFRQQTSNALLELAVLGGVDERVDEAVSRHQREVEVIIPASKVDLIAADADNSGDLQWTEAHDECAADHQCRDNCVASGRAYCRSSGGIHLKMNESYTHLRPFAGQLAMRFHRAAWSQVVVTSKWCSIREQKRSIISILHSCDVTLQTARKSRTRYFI